MMVDSNAPGQGIVPSRVSLATRQTTQGLSVGTGAHLTFELTGTAQFAVSELSDLLAEGLIMTWWDEFMEIPMPERRCKRHKWKDGWICERCGMNRADYEFIRTQDRSKYYIVNYGENQTRKFGYLHHAREFGFHYWHEGHDDFKAYNIVRVSNISRRVVYQQTGDILK